MNYSVKKSIAIIGGGASATLLLAQLIEKLPNTSTTSFTIYIIEPKHLNLGLAYSVKHPSFILNVPAKNMGAWADFPEGFYEWIKQYPYLWRTLHPNFLTVEYGPDDFVPRMIYGEYLRWIFEYANTAADKKNIKVVNITARASQVSQAPHHGAHNQIKNISQLRVDLDSNQSLLADAVIVATGNSLPKQPQLKGENIFSSPYEAEFFQQDWPKYKNVIVVGSGLSMADTIQYLACENYTGNIHIISRHGLVPLPHLTSGYRQDVIPHDFSKINSARCLIKAVRKYVDKNVEQNIPWQVSLNNLRQNTNAIWLSLPKEEQIKLRRVLPWWNILRHRIPHNTHELLTNLQTEGKLRITKGDVKYAEHKIEHFYIKIKNTEVHIKADKMIICSGYCYRQQLEDLCGELLIKENFGRPGDLKLSNNCLLYGIGPALSHLLFETTAINEIRQQSQKIAAAIAEAFCAEKACVTELL